MVKIKENNGRRSALKCIIYVIAVLAVSAAGIIYSVSRSSAKAEFIESKNEKYDMPSVEEREELEKPRIININTADKDELTSLDGIGETIAERIIEYRDANGSFGSTEDIKNVKGIGDKTFENIKDFITVE